MACGCFDYTWRPTEASTFQKFMNKTCLTKHSYVLMELEYVGTIFIVFMFPSRALCINKDI